jgi:periplasmic protein TonB
MPSAPPPPPPDAKVTSTNANIAASDAPIYAKGEPGITMPIVITEVRPNYTREAMQAKIEGTVSLSCVVETDGTVRDVTVLKSLDPALDGQAVLAAKQWRFQPGTKSGTPVRVRVPVEMTFTLRD